MDEENAGIFDAIAEDGDHSLIQEPATEETGTNENTEQKDGEGQAQTESVAEEANTSTSDDEKQTETEKPNDTTGAEGQKTKTDTTEDKDKNESADSAPSNIEKLVEDWKAAVPPAPKPYEGPVPEMDENGQVTNMTAAEYSDYIIARATANMRAENHMQTVEQRALDYAEQILPEIKSNPAIRQMVEDARVASIINGKQIDSVEAAVRVREALGIGTQQLASAKAEGARNAKHSIEIQKNAVLDSSSTQKAPVTDGKDELVKRINSGDNDAMAELLGSWIEEGIIQ
ncbi:MAG: hypothetical protein KDH96_02055 [Candidatus Riesia sp.]|nr:hypothetical protein [Candidatus Riesia sp.]